jgi:hypothetical protein
MTWENNGALGGTRTPNLLIRRSCQAFSVVRIGPQAGVFAIRLSGSVRLGGKPFARVAPSLAPSDRVLIGLSGWAFAPLSGRGPPTDGGSPGTVPA